MNDRMQAVFRGGVTACLLAWGCSNPSSSTPPPAVCSAHQGGAPSARSLASSNAAFAVDFYGPAASLAGAGTNLILSPYAVSATLTMVEGGAAGETATQVQKVLHMTGTAADLAPAYATLACEDETDGAAAGDQLSLANAVWGQKGKDFKASYLSLLSGGYDAPLQTVDFEGNASGALTDINEWVSTETQSQIASLLQPGDIDAKTRLVLSISRGPGRRRSIPTGRRSGPSRSPTGRRCWCRRWTARSSSGPAS
jgi:serine protease inhibitor